MICIHYYLYLYIVYYKGAFNFIGVMSFTVNMADVKADPQYAIGLDFVATFFFAIGAVMCVLDLQGCCMKRPPSAVGKGLMRPI